MQNISGHFKAFFLLICIFVLLPFSLYPQEEDEEIPQDIYEMPQQDLYTRGDQTFNVSLGTAFPTVFLDGNGKKIRHNFFPVGGQGSLSYNYFLGAHVFAGLEIGGLFDQTESEHMFFSVPMIGRLGYQFVISKFEFPITFGIGAIAQQYVEQRHFGFFIKPSAAAYYRFNPDWSFGIDTAWWWIPQWTKNSSTDVFGNLMSVSLSARYHF